MDNGIALYQLGGGECERQARTPCYGRRQGGVVGDVSPEGINGPSCAAPHVHVTGFEEGKTITEVLAEYIFNRREA